MKAQFDIDRLHALTSRLCDGEITDVEITALAELMGGNDAAINEYLSFTSLHLDLSQRMRSLRPTSEFAADVKHAIAEDAGRAKTALSSVPKRRSHAKWLGFLAVAASLLVTAIIWNRFASPHPNYAARIDEIVECDWNPSLQGEGRSKALSPGREIKFNHGLLRLEFASGAQVMLEGPVRFTVLSPDRGLLQFGRLTSAVPERAHGFTIQMPLAEVIDLGTRFGAVVAGDGSCEAHVFEGSVNIRRESGKGSSQEINLKAGSAVRIAANLADFTPLAAKSEAFVRVSGFADPAGSNVSSSTSLASEGRLVLWLDAARQLQFDGGKKVVGWRNLASEKVESEGDAWQIDAKLRPSWVPQAVGTHPAIRFDGSSYLVTAPIASGSDVTIVCVFKPQRNQLSNRKLAQIVNLNGPPNLVFGVASGKQVLGTLTSTIVGSDPAQADWLKSSLPETDGAVVAAYVYNHALNKSSLYVNAKLVGEARASLTADANSPKFVGISNSAEDAFVGDVGELLVFDSGLSNGQCIKISTELMSKYGLTKVEKEPRVLSHLSPDQN
jgi:hypothetical protein